MNALTDEHLNQIYEKAWDAHYPECGCHTAGLRAVAEAAVKDAVGGDEPFGYFRAEPFGWTDCKSTDDGARPLYERPQASQLNLDYLREMGRLEARIRELEQASAAVPEDKWKPLLEAVMREMPSREYRGNAPGHAHAVPGIWDSDNVPYLAGKPCAWCLAYSTARKLLAASQPEVGE